jgi:hypothetical protein
MRNRSVFFIKNRHDLLHHTPTSFRIEEINPQTYDDKNKNVGDVILPSDTSEHNRIEKRFWNNRMNVDERQMAKPPRARSVMAKFPSGRKMRV